MLKRSNINNYRFSVSDFSLRYLCGGTSMKERRHVTRTQMMLANLGFQYPDAIVVNREISYFKQAIKLFENHSFSLALLKRAHSLLVGKNSSTFRTSESWIGRSISTSVYPDTIKPDLVEHELIKLINQVNQEDLTDFGDKINIYMKLLRIHPFSDANGRLARAFFISQQKESSAEISPFLYRYQPNGNSLYITSCNDFDFSINKSDCTNTEFWQSALKWSEQREAVANLLISKTINTIQAKVSMYELNELERNIVNTLWEQPITSSSFLLKKLNSNKREISKAIDSLLGLGVLTQSKLNVPFKENIFHCENILKLYNKTEKFIFQD